MSAFPGPQHLELMRAGQRSLNAALPLIDNAEACGLDCTEYRQGYRALQDRIGNYIARFFPDQAIPIPGTEGQPNDG
jgi:hypothetical protein